jgi:hypothetical protein
MKVCTKCKMEKPFESFHRDWNQKSGYTSQCKECRYEYFKSYRKSEKGKISIAATQARNHQKNKQNPSRRASQKRNYARWVENSPRFILYLNLKHALQRRPTQDNPITLNYLMDLWRYQKGECAISGVQMTWNKGKLLPTSLSLDRIDQTQGYSIGNVRLVCFAVNTFRGRWSDDVMFEMATAIVAKANGEKFNSAAILSFAA